MRTIKILLVVMLVAGMGAALSSCRSDHEGHSSSKKSAQYHCPMHPTYVSDRPGDCPICGMRLVPIPTQQTAVVDEEVKPLYYRHPLDPDITSPVPMKDEMDMDYVPVFHDAKHTAGVEGRVPVALSPERQQLIGVRSAEVTRKKLENSIRASGRVAYDPDLYNAIVEHRQALQGKEQVKQSPWADVSAGAEALIRSSALRLRQMGLSEQQIRELATQTDDPTNLLLAEKGGSVWVYAQVYEQEAAHLQRGQVMQVSSPAFPGRTFQGRVVAVDSILNPETRTLRVCGNVPNRDGLLKPEMFVDVVIAVELGTKLAIPEGAVLKTGTRNLVFVETEPGHYAPRVVTLGHKAQDHYEVISGLAKGEKVVSSANFLIDSESRLKAVFSGGHHD
jgi:membrane fusion protein, copper/silver efflux system